MDELICKFCKKVCKNSNSHRNHERLCPENKERIFTENQKNYDKRKCGWSRGLNKNGCKSVKQRAESYSDKLKKGIIVPSFLGKTHSANTKEKLSETQSKLLEEKGNGGFLDVKYYSVSNIRGEQFKVRGTWELKYAEWLNNNGVLWVRKVYLKYRNIDDVSRTYAPDFYLPATNEYVEIKGYFSEKDKLKMKLVEEQNNLKVNILQYDDLKPLCLL